MGLINPLISIGIAVCFLLILLYKRVNLGIALTVTALFLALLAVDLAEIPSVIYKTSIDLPTVSVVLATFGIMLLSQLYKETGTIDKLSESISRLINNPRAVLCIVPAVIGLLPVAGGALMSAPLVEREAEKLKLQPSRKAYINLWFRHTIFPVYPLSPVTITAALLTGVSIPLLILRQIPVVIVMVTIGFIIGFWKVSKTNDNKEENKGANKNSDLRSFLISFSPILTTIIVTVIVDIAIPIMSRNGFDVVIAILIGLIVMGVVSRAKLTVFKKPFRTWGLYGVTLAAYGAFLLRNVVDASKISTVLSSFVTSGSVDITVFLIVAPTVLGFITGSPQGGVAVSVSILSGIFSLPFAVNVASMVYIGVYLGYTIAPTHLCFTFTADYFKCSLGKMYKYVIPSFLATFPVAILVYLLF